MGPGGANIVGLRRSLVGGSAVARGAGICVWLVGQRLYGLWVSAAVGGVQSKLTDAVLGLFQHCPLCVSL